MTKLNEDTLAEQPALEWLHELGYATEEGKNVSPEDFNMERQDYRDVILHRRLKRALGRLNPELADEQIEQVIKDVRQTDHPDLTIANQEVYRLLTGGVTVPYTTEEGESRGSLAKLIDFENPENNEFLAVNQFTVQGGHKLRRPDLVVFVNGLPLAVFEFKNPTDQNATLYSAYKQLLHEYKSDIPELFKFNQTLVISDMMYARHGVLTAPWEWFVPWKNVEQAEHQQTETQLQTLIYGLFDKQRFIDWMRNFIVYESEDNTTIKKTGLYHQYYGVNSAVDSTVQATSQNGDGRVGVFWHTQGSGKSLSMVFYVQKARRRKELRNPTFVFLTDRTDLDEQLYNTFLQCGYSHATRTESIEDLKKKLTNPSGDIIFTTIQKFGDEDFPVLSEASNIIVIADEAHRSQYAQLARNMREALPNASFMGITGTPISYDDRDTRLVFGDYVSTYKIDQAIEDGATVPIYYDGRMTDLHLKDSQLDARVEDRLEEEGIEDPKAYKQKYAQNRQAMSAEDRLQQVTNDLVHHYNSRNLQGKAMVVTVDRATAVRMYELITAHPDFVEEAAVVISGMTEFEDRIQEEQNVDRLATRFKNAEDPLRLVVVSDKWLTGFDVPSLHTMYLDKPLKGHTLMQAIARVNRKYKDKAGGLVVDYCGVMQELKQSLNAYSGQEEEPVIPIEELIEKLEEKYDIVRSYVSGLEIGEFPHKSSAEQAQMFQEGMNMVITDPQSGVIDEERKKRFLDETTQLAKLFALASPHPRTNEIRDEVEFFQKIKSALIKQTQTEAGEVSDETDSAIKQMISESIRAEGVVDIFDKAGQDTPDISIFDENFLMKVKEMRQQNVAIDVLRKLLNDDLKAKMTTNEARYESLMEKLQNVIDQYENNVIDSKKVIDTLFELAEEIQNTDEERAQLGLTDEELAFYDAIVKAEGNVENDEWVKELAQRLVKEIRRDLKVDWTNDQQVKARIRTNVQKLLLQKGFDLPQTNTLMERIFRQAYNLYKNVVPAG